MSPRRSSRARTSQISVGGPTQSSGSSSASSSRTERPTRSVQRQESLTKSETPRSPTSDDLPGGGPSESDTRQTRQRKREQEVLEPAAQDEMEEEDGDEEEITRCICRRQVFPGPPQPNGGGPLLPKDQQTIAFTGSSNWRDLPENADTFYVQCDDCKVWQHGYCVGITNEAMIPDNYYCEKCRNDLHKVNTAARGQKFSQYLPVLEPSPKAVRRASSTKEPEHRSSKDIDAKSASIAAANSAKKRSTMNSRAALDEEEMLRKVIEESKGEGSGDYTSSSLRKGKRGRDASEEIKQDLKRQKTSESETTSINPIGDESDSKENPSLRTIAAKKSRAVPGQVQRGKELRERDKDRERERAEAAKGRNERAGRRRGDDPEPLEESSLTKTTPKTSSTSKNIKGLQSRQLNGPAPLNMAPSKKTARAQPRRGRAGKNQHTRDTDKGESPRGSHTRDSDDSANGNPDVANSSKLLPNGSKPARPRHMNPSRTSMNDLRKRAAAILEYISRTQVELAGERTPPGAITPSALAVATALSRSGTPRQGILRRPSANGASKLSKEIDQNDRGEQVDGKDGAKEDNELAQDNVDEGTFRELSSRQMMDVLTKELMRWQNHHGKWGEKQP